MKHGIKLLVTACFIQSLCFASGAQSQIPTAIKLVSDNQYPPFMYQSTAGQASGLYIEIVEKVAEKLTDFDVEIETMAWKKARLAVKNADALGIVGPYFRAHEWDYMYPYSYPVMFETVVTVCKKDATIAKGASWPNDYSGLKIGTVGSYGGWLDTGNDYRSMGLINFFEYPNTQLALNAVLKDIVDCTVFSEGAFKATSPNYKASGLNFSEKTQLSIEQFEALDIFTRITQHSVHIGFSEQALNSAQNDSARAFIKQFDIELFKALRSGELDDLFKKYQLDKPLYKL